MTKKNLMMRIASVLLIAVVLTTSVIGGTLAKYTTGIYALDEAVVAKFAVEAFGVDAVVNDTATVNIFSTVYDTEGTDYSTGTDDADVLNGIDTPIVAPGTWGKFDIALQNLSEVTVSYAIKFTAAEAGVPLEWSLDGITWKDNVADLDIPATNIDINAAATSKTIYWRWIFNGNDVTDTGLGTATPLARPSIRIDVTFTQVD